MSDEWTPKVGELVKLTVDYVFPPARRGKPMSIRLAKVTKVTKSGYVYLAPHDDEKFRRHGPTRFNEVTRKDDFLRNATSRIEPASEEELATIPRDHRGAAEYAKAQAAARQGKAYLNV